MPAPRPLYIVLFVVVVALAGAVVLVWNYRPPGESASVGQTQQPTTGAGPDSSGAVPSTPPSGNTPSPRTEATPSGSPAATPEAPGIAKQTGPESVEPEELTGYAWPVRKALITSRFAPRDFGAFLIVDGRAIHDGLDLATRCGDRVRAAHDGTVLYAGRNFDPYFGYWGDADAIYARLERLGNVNDQPIVVVIDDGNGYRSVYVHLQEALVEAGQVVKAGDVIALEGQTGFATGCHLHYGLIRMDGPWQSLIPRLAQFGYPLLVRERINPLKVLPHSDQYAPQVLQDKANATPTPSASPPASPTASPVASPSPAPSMSPSNPPSSTPTPLSN